MWSVCRWNKETYVQWSVLFDDDFLSNEGYLIDGVLHWKRARARYRNGLLRNIGLHVNVESRLD